MLKSILSPMMISLLFLNTGCGLFNQTEPIIVDDALFCDVEEPRRFTQVELDWRSANAPWNLRRDFKTNKTWDRECTSEGSTPEEIEEEDEDSD